MGARMVRRREHASMVRSICRAWSVIDSRNELWRRRTERTGRPQRGDAIAAVRCGRAATPLHNSAEGHGTPAPEHGSVAGATSRGQPTHV